MKTMKKTATILAMALSLTMMFAGAAISGGGGEEAVLMAKEDRIVKPVKSGLETRCRYNEFEDIYSCRK